jgi:hypothetical protein
MSVSTPSGEGDLGGKQYLTVVVRLLVDERGMLVHGEVADLHGACEERFVGWEGIVPAVQACLARRGPGTGR